jgi:uncharacterized small protein (DUF1192 family)
VGRTASSVPTFYLIRSAYNNGYEAGQEDLLRSLKAYFPDMTCVADISLRIEALQDEVKRGNA